ncbi:MAG: prenyltransferase/squalene oxidase repeat-containing protein [Bryobacteraceae bacterium]
MQAEETLLQQKLIASQNADGGWGYRNGPSWTEPTTLALLALQLSQEACERGLCWLRKTQRSDGGWPPQPSVGESTWVTSLGILATPENELNSPASKAALNWLIAQAKPPNSAFERFLLHLRGLPIPIERGSGESWFPQTAAWVYPTAMAVLALSYAAGVTDHQRYRDLAQKGKQYILSRRCPDGGWNHGGSRYLSENADSYPEMTGLALLALTGMSKQDLAPSLKQARLFLTTPESIEGLSWLQMGLRSQGSELRYQQTNLPCRTTRDIALRSLALASFEGRNRLLTFH